MAKKIKGTSSAKFMLGGEEIGIASNMDDIVFDVFKVHLGELQKATGMLPIIAIGPKGGQIVGYKNPGHVPIYQGSKAAAKLAAAQGMVDTDEMSGKSWMEMVGHAFGVSTKQHGKFVTAYIVVPASKANDKDVIITAMARMQAAVMSTSGGVKSVSALVVKTRKDGSKALGMRLEVKDWVKVAKPKSAMTAGASLNVQSSGYDLLPPNHSMVAHNVDGTDYTLTHSKVPGKPSSFIVNVPAGGTHWEKTTSKFYQSFAAGVLKKVIATKPLDLKFSTIDEAITYVSGWSSGHSGNFTSNPVKWASSGKAKSLQGLILPSDIPPAGLSAQNTTNILLEKESDHDTTSYLGDAVVAKSNFETMPEYEEAFKHAVQFANDLKSTPWELKFHASHKFYDMDNTFHTQGDFEEWLGISSNNLNTSKEALAKVSHVHSPNAVLYQGHENKKLGFKVASGPFIGQYEPGWLTSKTYLVGADGDKIFADYLGNVETQALIDGNFKDLKSSLMADILSAYVGETVSYEGHHTYSMGDVELAYDGKYWVATKGDGGSSSSSVDFEVAAHVFKMWTIPPQLPPAPPEPVELVSSTELIQHLTPVNEATKPITHGWGSVFLGETQIPSIDWPLWANFPGVVCKYVDDSGNTWAVEFAEGDPDFDDHKVSIHLHNLSGGDDHHGLSPMAAVQVLNPGLGDADSVPDDHWKQVIETVSEHFFGGLPVVLDASGKTHLDTIPKDVVVPVVGPPSPDLKDAEQLAKWKATNSVDNFETMPDAEVEAVVGSMLGHGSTPEHVAQAMASAEWSWNVTYIDPDANLIQGKHKLNKWAATGKFIKPTVEKCPPPHTWKDKPHPNQWISVDSDGTITYATHDPANHGDEPLHVWNFSPALAKKHKHLGSELAQKLGFGTAVTSTPSPAAKEPIHKPHHEVGDQFTITDEVSDALLWAEGLPIGTEVSSPNGVNLKKINDEGLWEGYYGNSHQSQAFDYWDTGEKFTIKELPKEHKEKEKPSVVESEYKSSLEAAKHILAMEPQKGGPGIKWTIEYPILGWDLKTVVGTKETKPKQVKTWGQKGTFVPEGCQLLDWPGSWSDDSHSVKVVKTGTGPGEWHLEVQKLNGPSWNFKPNLVLGIAKVDALLHKLEAASNFETMPDSEPEAMPEEKVPAAVKLKYVKAGDVIAVGNIGGYIKLDEGENLLFHTPNIGDEFDPNSTNQQLIAPGDWPTWEENFPLEKVDIATVGEEYFPVEDIATVGTGDVLVAPPANGDDLIKKIKVGDKFKLKGSVYTKTGNLSYKDDEGHTWDIPDLAGWLFLDELEEPTPQPPILVDDGFDQELVKDLENSLESLLHVTDFPDKHHLHIQTSPVVAKGAKTLTASGTFITLSGATKHNKDHFKPVQGPSGQKWKWSGEPEYVWFMDVQVSEIKELAQSVKDAIPNSDHLSAAQHVIDAVDGPKAATAPPTFAKDVQDTVDAIPEGTYVPSSQLAAVQETLKTFPGKWEISSVTAKKKGVHKLNKWATSGKLAPKTIKGLVPPPGEWTNVDVQHSEITVTIGSPPFDALDLLLGHAGDWTFKPVGWKKTQNNVAQMLSAFIPTTSTATHKGDKAIQKEIVVDPPVLAKIVTKPAEPPTPGKKIESTLKEAMEANNFTIVTDGELEIPLKAKNPDTGKWEHQKDENGKFINKTLSVVQVAVGEEGPLMGGELLLLAAGIQSKHKDFSPVKTWFDQTLKKSVSALTIDKETFDAATAVTYEDASISDSNFETMPEVIKEHIIEHASDYLGLVTLTAHAANPAHGIEAGDKLHVVVRKDGVTVFRDSGETLAGYPLPKGKFEASHGTKPQLLRFLFKEYVGFGGLEGEPWENYIKVHHVGSMVGPTTPDVIKNLAENVHKQVQFKIDTKVIKPSETHGAGTAWGVQLPSPPWSAWAVMGEGGTLKAYDGGGNEIADGEGAVFDLFKIKTVGELDIKSFEKTTKSYQGAPIAPGDFDLVGSYASVMSLGEHVSMVETSIKDFGTDGQMGVHFGSKSLASSFGRMTKHKTKDGSQVHKCIIRLGAGIHTWIDKSLEQGGFPESTWSPSDKFDWNESTGQFEHIGTTGSHSMGDGSEQLARKMRRGHVTVNGQKVGVTLFKHTKDTEVVFDFPASMSLSVRDGVKESLASLMSGVADAPSGDALDVLNPEFDPELLRKLKIVQKFNPKVMDHTVSLHDIMHEIKAYKGIIGNKKTFTAKDVESAWSLLDPATKGLEIVHKISATSSTTFLKEPGPIDDKAYLKTGIGTVGGYSMSNEQAAARILSVVDKGLMGGRTRVSVLGMATMEGQSSMSDMNGGTDAAYLRPKNGRGGVGKSQYGGNITLLIDEAILWDTTTRITAGDEFGYVGKSSTHGNGSVIYQSDTVKSAAFLKKAGHSTGYYDDHSPSSSEILPETVDFTSVYGINVPASSRDGLVKELKSQRPGGANGISWDKLIVSSDEISELEDAVSTNRKLMQVA